MHGLQRSLASRLQLCRSQTSHSHGALPCDFAMRVTADTHDGEYHTMGSDTHNGN